MSLSFVQKFNVFLIQMVLNGLWLFDAACVIKKRYALAGVSMGLGIVLLLTNISGVSKQVSLNSDYLQRALVAYVYSETPFSNAQGVLGSSSVRHDYPYKFSEATLPDVTAKSIIVMDLRKDKVLYDLNSDVKLAPASTTKLMTALISLDLYNLNEVLTVPYLCTLTESQKIGFPADSRVSVKDLLYTLLIGSGGDSACTLATSKVSYNDFVTLMNSKAESLGMDSTQFTNPIGLDGAHFSTAHDLYVLTKYVLKNPLFVDIVDRKEYPITTLDNSFSTTVVNTNRLLWDIPGSVGVKTGRTQEAGEVLIYEYSKDSRDIVIVVMGSLDRFKDTTTILHWILSVYKWE